MPRGGYSSSRQDHIPLAPPGFGPWHSVSDGTRIGRCPFPAAGAGRAGL